MDLFRPCLLPMSLGSLPHVDAAQAWQAVLRYFPEIPTWPQLPALGFRENMYAQVSAGFPGLVLQDERLFVDRSRELDGDLEQLYVRYLADEVDQFAIGPEYAAGLWMTEAALDGRQPAAMKGQLTGPISWGLMVVDQDRRPILYDDILADAVARHLRMKAEWQERYLGRFSERTVMLLDEPYLSSFGSAFVAIDRGLVQDLLGETLAGLGGLHGVHCCGNTDWGLLLSTPIDVLSLDAYEFAGTLALYPEELGTFLQRGGMIAWGLVPNSAEAERATAAGLLERFEGAVRGLEAKGISREWLLESAFITPACGTGRLTPALAERIFALTREVSALARDRYLGIRNQEDFH